MISPIVPGATNAAFDSSVSICIANAKSSRTLTTTSPKSLTKTEVANNDTEAKEL